MVDSAEKIFRETANTYTLSVAILIAVAVALFGCILVVVRWAKPLFEKWVASSIAAIDATKLSNEAILKTQQKQQVALDRIIDLQERQCEGLDEHSAKLDQVIAASGKTTEAVNKLACRNQQF